MAVNIWELRCADINDYTVVVASREALLARAFEVDGSPLDWEAPPVVEYSDFRSRGKTIRPMADVSAMRPGSMVLSQRAVDALGDFLGEFGQLLPVQTAGGADWRYFYNVTRIVKCVDLEHSEKSPSGALSAESFYDINVPRSAAVFKDPLTAKQRIYVNDAGKELIDASIARAGLTGIECATPKRWA